MPVKNQGHELHVELVGLTQSYRRKKVLDDFNWVLPDGITALLGPNGAGKTTLMRTLVTEMRPAAGSVVIDGKPLRDRATIRDARQRIGYLGQTFGYDPKFTVTEHVSYMAWRKSIPRSDRAREVQEAIAAVDLLDAQEVQLKALSGGMRQRAGIGGALVGHPDLLVLDEPTVGLDPGQRAEFRNVITRLQAGSILLSTHLTDDVAAVADNVAVLTAGKLTFQGTVAEFQGDSTSVEEAYLRHLSKTGVSSSQGAQA